VNTTVERYDAFALDYARYWAPVLDASARRLLDDVDPFVAELGGTVEVLDVGSGTGALALAALSRWPQARVIASDASAGMLAVGRTRADQAALNGERLRFVQGEAARLPIEETSVDVVVSSFVLQLVPDRPAALREAYRVLRPGGRLAYVTWIDRDARMPFRPMEEFDEAVLDLQVDEEEEEPDGCAGDVPSPRAAADQLRRAGFASVRAREDELVYDWTLESYLDYKLAYDERRLMSTLDADQRRRLEENVRRRLGLLSPADFRFHAPIVFASGDRPGRRQDG
jgi:SAM-dependent methyltransferase